MDQSSYTYIGLGKTWTYAQTRVTYHSSAVRGIHVWPRVQYGMWQRSQMGPEIEMNATLVINMIVRWHGKTRVSKAVAWMQEMGSKDPETMDMGFAHLNSVMYDPRGHCR